MDGAIGSIGKPVHSVIGKDASPGRAALAGAKLHDWRMGKSARLGLESLAYRRVPKFRPRDRWVGAF